MRKIKRTNHKNCKIRKKTFQAPKIYPLSLENPAGIGQSGSWAKSSQPITSTGVPDITGQPSPGVSVIAE